MGSWTTKERFPVACGYSSGVSCSNNKMYLLVANDEELVSYEPSTDTWDTGLSTGNYNGGDRSLMVSFYKYGDHIITAGGYDGNNYLDTVKKYHVGIDEWWNRQDMPESISKCGGAIYGDYLYVFGGYGGDGGFHVISHVYRYDAYRDSWDSSPVNSNYSINTGIGNDPIVETVGDYIWVINSGLVRKYDPNSNTYVATYSFNSPITRVDNYSGHAVLDTKIYIAGGYNLKGDSNQAAFVSYDTATNTWDTSLPDMPDAKNGGGAAIINGKFYTSAGTGTGGYDTYEYSFTPPTNPGGDINPYKTRVRG